MEQKAGMKLSVSAAERVTFQMRRLKQLITCWLAPTARTTEHQGASSLPKTRRNYPPLRISRFRSVAPASVRQLRATLGRLSLGANIRTGTLTAAPGKAAPAGRKWCIPSSNRLGLPGWSIYGQKTEIVSLMGAKGPPTVKTE